MKYMLSLLFAATLTTAQAQNSYLLEGTIGAYPAVMNLSYDDSTCGATYFYKSAKRDIQLSGNTVGINLFLHNIKWNSKAKKNDTLETIVLSNRVKDVFTGRWTNNKQEDLAIELHKVDIKNTQNPYNSIPYVKMQKMEDPYNYMRIAAMNVIKDSVIKKGRLTLEYVHVENSKINLFRVAGDQSIVTDKINTILNAALMESAARYFSCNSYEYVLRHVFVSGNVMSINTFKEYECGGAANDTLCNALFFSNL